MDLKTALGRTVSWDEARLAMEAGFAQALGVTLAAGELTAGEEATAKVLFTEKYTNQSWTLKR